MNKFSLDFMSLALDEARKAYDLDEVPVGAIIVQNDEVIGASFNQVISQNSVAAHAEMNAILLASQKLENYRLIDCDIYVTLEPCHMCAKAIVDARLNNLFFGASEPKTGAIVSVDRFLDESHLNHRVNYSSGYLKAEASNLLKTFFKSKRI
ncbi:nucleoside deaminase [Gammaproteobacteria bacterium]|jgi:tRNA(adenine34) deaminase|nr:nucleoside deaminase [Gammaproteobacteria bacterium]MDB9947885.1 nucleoside deaminase [Gammaproteobacteria bacterium]